MPVTIKVFGQLTEIFPHSEWIMEDIADTDHLIRVLSELYPALGQAIFNIAVDKQIIQSNTSLKDNPTVALLPPYAGG